MQALLIVAFGGALGAVARYVVHVTFANHAEFPWGTLVANLAGCLAMGIFVQLLTHHATSGGIHENYRLLFAVGFCGSFTTLSAFVFEMAAFIERNAILSSATYFLATMIGAFVCFYAGLLLTRSLLERLT